MAAEVNARQNKQPTIAFTLPISCQVCLGKVKNPVLCPNNHVFCSTCMDVWLQKTKQCPACRVTMTASKKILGGLSQHEDNNADKLTNPEFRKARFDLLYKEYENEFERMQSELQLLKTENQILKQQSRRDGSSDSRSGESSRADTNNLLLLTKKLQDATKLYEKVKGELSRLKQENNNLKDEGVTMNRENTNLRQELAGRSPHRYGRTTVATLETKLASAEKDITRLTKAMERSDKYIEELEAELDGYRGTSSGKSGSSKTDKYLTNGDAAGARKVYSDSKVSQYSSQRAGDASRKRLFTEEKESKSATGERSKYYYDRNGDGKSSQDVRDEYSDYSSSKSAAGRSQSAKHSVQTNGKKRVTFDLEKNTNATTSFDLELPSPLKASANKNSASNGRASPVKGVLKKTGGKGSSDDKSMDSYSDFSRTGDDSDTFTSKYTSRQSKDDDLVYLKSRSRSSANDYDETDDLYSKSKKRYSADDSFLSEPSSMEVKSLSDLEYSSRRSGDKRASDYDRKPSSYDRKSGDYDTGRGQSDYDTGRGRRGGSRERDDDLSREDLEDTQYIESELDELNISLTPEFTDCMKLLNRAEKKVSVHDTSDEEDTLSRYTSSQDKDTDAAFRASTGSIGYKSGGLGDDLRSSTGSYGYKPSSTPATDLTSSYKPDVGADRFASSLDSYSRRGHVRSGSLDNIYLGGSTGQEERPGSALPSTSNMYSSTTQSKYSTGLTTGRTTLTRTPSFDNLLMSRPGSAPMLSRPSLQGYPGVRSYGGENEEPKLDVNANIPVGTGGTSTTGQAPSTALHGLDRPRDDKVTFDSVLQARARSISDMGSGQSDADRKLLSGGRLTPTFPGTSASGRGTPTLPSHSEYLSMPKSSLDKYSLSGTGSGRTTPTLTSTSNYDALTKPSTQFSEYRTSGNVDMSLKPPSGVTVRQPDIPSTIPAYLTASTSYANPAPSKGYSSLPMYNSTAGGGNLDSGPMSAPYTDNKYSESTKSDFDYDKFNPGARPSSISSSSQPSYNSDDKLASLKSYSDHNFLDSDFTSYSSKPSSSTSHMSVPLPSSSNPSSALFTGSSSSTSSLGGLGSSYSGSSYLPSSGVPTMSSYTSALSVPLTHTTSSYTASAPANTYTSKTLDPITESNHFSYVSNASGDYSSKNDTFGLPEPKKRLFEDSEDMNMSVSPIKTNKRF